MKKKGKLDRLCFLLILTAFLSGCGSVGEDEIIAPTVQGELEESKENGGEKTLIGTLTEEEAENVHLSGWLDQQVQVDAYMTPYSFYKDGVGQWTMDKSDLLTLHESYRLYSEMDGSDRMLYDEKLNFEKTMESVDRMAASLGPVYEEAWQETKEQGKNIRSIFSIHADESLDITTVGSRLDGNPYGEAMDLIYYSEESGLDFLDKEQALRAAEELAGTLIPELSEHAYFGIQSKGRLAAYAQIEYPGDEAARKEIEEEKECYYIRFAQAVDGIPIRQSYVVCRIKAGEMAKDSMNYSEEYETSDYAVRGNTYADRFHIYISDTGFSLYVTPKRETTVYKERQPVLGINEVLSKAKSILGARKKDMIVTNIELVMSETVADEGEKKRIVLSPHWCVTYYAHENYNGNIIMGQQMLTLDAYTGEIDWDSYIYP